MAANQTQRPKFYEEQYLGAADLTAAVDYGRIQNARHSLGGHTWGIAMGLTLKETPQPGGAVSVHLLPGYAWDGYGRPIVVLSPYRIPEEKFSKIIYDDLVDQSGKGRLIQIWIRYDENAARNPPSGFESCNTTDQYSRIAETFRIEITDPAVSVDRYSGVTVASKSLTDATTALRTFDLSAQLVYDESVPHQVFPDPQTRSVWLIPIGFVRWQPVKNGPGHFVPRDDSGSPDPEKDTNKIRHVRRYAGVVTEEIEAADGAIRLRYRGKDPAASFFETPTKDQLDAAIANLEYEKANDLVWVEGNLRVVGNAKLAAGKLEFRDHQGKDRGVPLKLQRDGYGGGAGAPRALQAVIGPITQLNHRFAVGPMKADGTVDEKFAVVSNGNVGIGVSNPTLKLEIRGDDFGRDDGPATLHLWGSRIGDAGGGVLFVRALAGGVVAFDGNNNRVGVGTNVPVSKLEVSGDVALQKMASGPKRALPADATMCWNDGVWLRLNQNLDFSKPIFGVHTPGLFAPNSLNVGGLGGWGDPGGGNACVSGRVGIGTITPQASLQVTGGAIMPAIGNGPGAGIQFPSDPGGGLFDEAFIRYFAISGETTKLLIGINNDADDTIGFHQFGAERMTISSGMVGIGTNNPQALLHVNGDAAKPTGFFWTMISDARLKRDITPVTGALGRLMQLRGVSFHWKEPDKMGKRSGPQIGLVAQEVEPVFPEWVGVSRDGNLTLTIHGFEALVIEALRELRAEIETLKQPSNEQPAPIPAGEKPGDEKEKTR